MSRQNDWKVKQFNKGNCIWCGKPREVPGFKRTCRACGKKHRARLRVKRGSSAWRKPGDMGRPPLWAAVSKTPPRPVESKDEGNARAVLEQWKGTLDWCRCGGNGFWYEQIDGPDNMRKVKCERHDAKYLREAHQRGVEV